MDKHVPKSLPNEPPPAPEALLACAADAFTGAGLLLRLPAPPSTGLDRRLEQRLLRLRLLLGLLLGLLLLRRLVRLHSGVSSFIALPGGKSGDSLLSCLLKKTFGVRMDDWADADEEDDGISCAEDAEDGNKCFTCDDDDGAGEMSM